jgi:hypothetical protein
VVSLGQARAGTGRMLAFLKQVSPALAKQLVAAKSNEEAFDLLAAAMTKLKDPAKRAALAQKTVGDAALAPLFARGAEGIKQLRARYSELAGSQEDAAKKAGIVDDSMKDLHASMDGVKAAIVSGLAPGIKIIVDRLRDWFVAHRGDIAEFAKTVGDHLPAAFEAVANAIKKVVRLLEKAYEVAKKVIDAVDYLNPVGGLGATAAGGERFAEQLGLGPKSRAIRAMPSALDNLSTKLYGNPFVGPPPEIPVGPVQPRFDRPDVSGKAAQALAGSRTDSRAISAALANAGAGTPSGAKITVDFANAPRGTRVRTDPSSTADVDLSVGYQMGAP